MNESLEQFDVAAIRKRRYGVIETINGRLHAIRFRRWPKLVTLFDVQWLGPRFHHRMPGDRCLVYYNQPLWHSNFLALAFVISTRDCTLKTFHGGLTVLDEIARLKRSDALLCDAWNARISDRLLARWGWQPHAPSRWHRNYIKRFYGSYPAAITQLGTVAAIKNLEPQTTQLNAMSLDEFTAQPPIARC